MSKTNDLEEDLEVAALIAKSEALRRNTPPASEVARFLKELEKFLEDNPLMTEERIMAEYESGVKTGVARERARIIKYIEVMAAGYFVERRDEKAKEARDLAALIKTHES